MKKLTRIFMTMLLIAAMALPSFAVFAAEPEDNQIDMLDYIIYREDGTIRETGTIPNGEPKTRYSWTGITLYNSETAVLKPAGAAGLYAYAGTRIEFSYTLNRSASHFYALTGNNVGYLSSNTVTSSAVIVSSIAETFDAYYGIIVNYSSDPFTINRANIVF